MSADLPCPLDQVVRKSRDADVSKSNECLRPIWRKVVSTTTRMNPGAGKSRFVGGSVRLDLECGHEWHRKISQGVPDRARCSACESLRRGATRISYNLDGTQTEETWDAVTNELVRTTTLQTAETRARWGIQGG